MGTVDLCAAHEGRGRGEQALLLRELRELLPEGLVGEHKGAALEESANHVRQRRQLEEERECHRECHRTVAARVAVQQHLPLRCVPALRERARLEHRAHKLQQWLQMPFEDRVALRVVGAQRQVLNAHLLELVDGPAAVTGRAVDDVRDSEPAQHRHHGRMPHRADEYLPAHRRRQVVWLLEAVLAHEGECIGRKAGQSVAGQSVARRGSDRGRATGDVRTRVRLGHRDAGHPSQKRRRGDEERDRTEAESVRFGRMLASRQFETEMHTVN